MFFVRNVPVVIEPGIGAIEAEFAVSEGSKKPRGFPVQLTRVALDSESAAKLPFIPATRLPHVFSLTSDPDESSALVVYDNLGRITFVYVRDDTGKAWDKREVAAEHAGKTVTQFSVRFSFSSSKLRDKFMELVDNVISQLQNDQKPNMADVEAAFTILSRSRVAPAVMPVAVAKNSLSGVKI
jgi:hypothetical protein